MKISVNSIKKLLSHFFGLFLWPIYFIISGLENVIEAGLLIYNKAHIELPGLEKIDTLSEEDKKKWMVKYGHKEEFSIILLDAKYSFASLKSEQLEFLFEFLSIYRDPDSQGCIFEFNYHLVERHIKRRDEAISIVRWWINIWITLFVAYITFK